MNNIIFDIITQADPDGSLLSALDSVVENSPHKPSRIQDLGLFRYESLLGTRVDFNVVENGTALAPITTDRAAASTNVTDATQSLVDFRSVKISKTARITEEDIRDVRAILQASQDPRIAYETAVAALQRRLGRARTEARNSFEWVLLGALRNQVNDHTGTLITDMHAKMGTSDPGTLYLDVANMSNGQFLDACGQIVDSVSDALGEMSMDHVHCFVPSATMRQIANLTETREAFTRQNESAFLRQGKGYGTTFEYGEVVFETYRGQVGGTSYLGADEMLFFPVGADNFYCGFAPATRLRSDIGEPEFLLPYEDPRGEFAEVEVQINPVAVNLRPLSTIVASAGADPAP